MATYFVPDGGEDGDERTYSVDTVGPGTFRVTHPDGSESVVDAYQPEPGRLHLLRDGASLDFDVREDDGSFTVQRHGSIIELEVLNERQKRMRAAGVGARGAGGPDLLSPMAGKVVAVQIVEGDEVTDGDVVVIVEAMKMENDLKAHIAGTIAHVHVAPGEAVEIGDALVSIE